MLKQVFQDVCWAVSAEHICHKMLSPSWQVKLVTMQRSDRVSVLYASFRLHFSPAEFRDEERVCEEKGRNEKRDLETWCTWNSTIT